MSISSFGNFTRLIRAVLLFLTCCFVLPVWAQQSLEIIELKYRPVDEVVPVLQPLLEPGATLSGMNNQLFLRASPRNRAEIKRALASIDMPARRLLIKVATDMSGSAREQGGQIRGGVESGRVRVETPEGGSRGGSGVTARIYDSRSASSGNGTQMVQTVDGGRAFIQVGQSVAVPMRQVIRTPGGGRVVSDTVEYREIGRGFYVEPRLAGDRVTLEISQQSDTPDSRSGPGGARIQHLSSTVTGRLGEWIQLGGSSGSVERDGRGAWSLSTESVRNERGIWLMVEELP